MTEAVNFIHFEALTSTSFKSSVLVSVSSCANSLLTTAYKH